MPEDSVYYDSYKEDRDLILEYNQVSLDDANVINICGIGIDNLTRIQAVVKIIKMADNGGVHHVMSLNPYKMHRIKFNTDLKNISSQADVHLAAGSGLQAAAKILKNPIKERIPTISFMMDIIRISEMKEYPIFLVGGKPESTEQAFFNIKKSFPKIRIVGRHGGFFNSEREKSVIEAMRKSYAKIIFIGMGFPREDIWIDKIKKEFSNSIFISVGGCIDIISGHDKKAPAFFMDRGLDWLFRIMIRPWRIGRFARVILFYFQVIYTRLRGKV
jgi:N-acetylglucosaminyldiphosphoundecaprenol N-acetyl-beta-D-mannosaminyltransferase